MAVSVNARGSVSCAKKMTPEIYFARKLASNDKKIRDKTLKKLKKWINARSNVTDGMFLDVWSDQLFELLSYYVTTVSCSFLRGWVVEAVERIVLLHVDVRQTADPGRSGWNNLEPGALNFRPADVYEIYQSFSGDHGQRLAWYWHLEDG